MARCCYTCKFRSENNSASAVLTAITQLNAAIVGLQINSQCLQPEAGFASGCTAYKTKCQKSLTVTDRLPHFERLQHSRHGIEFVLSTTGVMQGINYVLTSRSTSVAPDPLPRFD